MADLGTIGIQHTSVSVRVIPLNVTAETGTARLLKNPLNRTIFNTAEAQSTSKNYPRAFVQDIWRITQGRQAVYLKDFTEIRGTVKNSAGTGIARRVLVVNRAGQCVGTTVSAADGTFKCLLDNQAYEVVLVVAIPDDGDNRNAVVKWKVVPASTI